MKTIQKNKSFEEKPRSEMLLETNKDYRNAEFQQAVGDLLVSAVPIYLLVGYMYYFCVKTLNSIAHRFESKIIGFFKPSDIDSFQEPTVWEVIKKYSLGQPVAVVASLILLFALGSFLIYKGRNIQFRIESNTDDEKLKKDYEKLKEERYSDYDCYNQKLD
ncbi:TPA: hypothetical protein U2D44_000415 [Streptococcus suis]|nr:hypothetical protein [Streptococcus suis]HEM6431138.1 hypothetical protein [Streptococcus suis]